MATKISILPLLNSYLKYIQARTDYSLDCRHHDKLFTEMQIEKKAFTTNDYIVVVSRTKRFNEETKAFGYTYEFFPIEKQ